MSTKITPTYYILHGKNGFERAEYIRTMKARMGKGSEAELNIREFQAESCTPAEVLNDVTTYPFLNDKRLVIVYGLLTALGKRAGKAAKAELDQFVARLPTLPEYARLMLVESDDLPESHPALKLLETDTHGYEKLFGLPKNMAEWIAKRAIAYEAQIEPRAAILLAEWVGQDIYTADNEVAKLVAFVGGARPIKEADVEALSANEVESKIWEIADLVGGRRGKQALTLAHKLLDEGQEAIPLLGMIYGQYRKLLMIKAFEAEGVNGNLVEALALRGNVAWTVGRLREQAAKYSYDELQKIHRTLLDTDFKVKTGQYTPVLALDLLIATLTA